jgi:hypothetical protein
MMTRGVVIQVVSLLGVTVVRAEPDEVPKPLTEVKNDNDHIPITVAKEKVAKDKVEFVLKIAPNMTWHKKLRAFSGTGTLGEIEVHDDMKEATITLDIDKLDRIVLGKASIGGVSRWDYKISDLQTLGGSRITLSWEKD